MSVKIKDITNNFRTFVDEHSQLHDFDYGDMSDLNPTQYKWPLLFLMSTPSTINKDYVTLRFDMYLMDQLEQDMSNREDINSNLFILANDIITNFWINKSSEYGWWVDTDFTITPMTGKFDSLLGVMKCNIEIHYMNNSGCKIIPTI